MLVLYMMMFQMLLPYYDIFTLYVAVICSVATNDFVPVNALANIVPVVGSLNIPISSIDLLPEAVHT